MGKSSCVYKAKNAIRSNLTPPKGADVRTRRQLSEPRSGSEDTSSKEVPTETVIIDKLRINPVAFGYVDLDSATKILKEFKNPTLPVKIPSKINGIALSAKQKEELRNGNRIKVPAAGNPGKTVSVKLSEDGRPVVVPPAKPAIKQEPEQHRSIR